MQRTLKRIDDFISGHGLSIPEADPAVRIPFLANSDSLTLDLQRGGIRSVIWATGYIRRYPWLKVPVLDHCGEIIHHGGVAAVPGLYVLGLTFLRRRRSPFIDGCGLDAEDIASLIEAHLNLSARRVA
jgi:putative flavoprotein involved in K+ transport